MSKDIKIIQNNQKEDRTVIYQRQQMHIDRQKEIGFVNPETGAFMGLKADGEVASGLDILSQDKKVNQKSLEVTPEKIEVTNRKSLITDDLLINHQKFNTQLLKLSDTSKLFDYQTIGGLTLNGTVMVKVWEKNLGRYVLMRRPIRTPLFSRVLEAPEIPEILDFDIAHVYNLNNDLAQHIKLQREAQNKVTDEMQDAVGGSAYDQGIYNNYTTDFNGGVTDVTGMNTSTNLGSGGGAIDDSYNITGGEVKGPIVITEKLLPVGSARRTGKKLNLKGITIHSTGNPTSNATGERAWLENPDNNEYNRLSVAWHLCIDENTCVMAVPLDEYTVHANSGNDTTFGIEICESGNRQKTLDRAATLVAQLMLKYGFKMNNIYRHYDWSGKICPGILSANNWAGWTSFKKLIQEKLNSSLLVNTNPNKNLFCWPCPEAKIVSDKIPGNPPRDHDGWDITEHDAINKNISICASRGGTIEVANQYDKSNGSWGGYGGCVIINHGEGIKTLYGHLKNNSLVVKVGQKVIQGQKLGIMGNTGSSTGCHLHFSIYEYDSVGKKTVINPEGILDSSS